MDGVGLPMTARDVEGAGPNRPALKGVQVRPWRWTLSAARRAVEAASAGADRHGLAVVVAVVDAGGTLVTMDRMDGAPLLSVDLAVDKAWTAVAFGIPTEQWWPLLRDDPALAAGLPHRPRLVIFGGGVPLRAGGALVGGIGVSGGTAQQDAAIAQEGATAFEGPEANDWGSE